MLFGFPVLPHFPVSYGAPARLLRPAARVLARGCGEGMAKPDPEYGVGEDQFQTPHGRIEPWATASVKCRGTEKTSIQS